MKNKRIFKASALLLAVALLLGIVNIGANEDVPGSQTKIYSDWLNLNGYLGSEESTEPQSGTSDLSALLREAVLLDADGRPLAKDDVWPVDPDVDYRVRLTFRETPGSGDLQFATEDMPLVFRLPKGLSAGDENLDLPLRVSPDKGDATEAVCAYDAAAGTLSVSLDPETAELIRASEGTTLEAVIPASFADTDTLAFADHLKVSLRRTDYAKRGTTDRSSDLADFLKEIEIENTEINEAGEYIIIQGVPYTVQMKFEEKTNVLQFEDDPDVSVLVYHFPDGFTPLGTSGRFALEGDGGAVWFDYTIGKNEEDEYVLTVIIDKDNSPGYERFRTSEDVNFEIETTGVITKERIEFSDEVTGKFDIDDSRNVTVTKTGAYDAALNRIKYTVQAVSKGNNTNIHIGDIISGTALTYDAASFTISSNVRENVPYTPETRPGETFGLTIPTMVDGETVTVEYYADVNLSGLTDTGSGHYGTIDETGNSVQAHFDYGPPDPPVITISDKDFTNRISLSTNSKAASSQTVRDGKTYVTWTIVLNENANISIAGKSVTDSIAESCRDFMRYAGSGIHIERYAKDGTSAGASDIPWGSGGLTPSFGGSSWTYTIPDTDAGSSYRYVITYETEVDSGAFLQTTSVGNTVHNDYDTDTSWTGVDTTGDEVEASKKAGTSTVDAVNKEAETEWEITFTVPPTGLDSAVVTDSMPAFLNSTDMIWFYDAYKAGSARVDGLLDGEAFTVDAASQPHQVVISFTKNNGDPGLTGNGTTRTIHIYLKTQAGSDWLNYAETESRARTHVNNAVVRLNGQDIHVTASATYNTTAYDLEKEQYTLYHTGDESYLPIYMYKIILSNVNENAFDKDGYLTITDQYDSDYLVFYPNFNTHDFGSNVNGHVFGNNSYNKGNLTNPGPYVVASTSEGQIIFKLHKDDLPMNLADGSYWAYYTIVYGLQVKDAQTLETLQYDALHADGLSVKMDNTAYSDLFGTNTIVTDYTIEALKKEKLGEAVYNSATGTTDLHFKITVNPEKLQIGDEDTITVRDTISNLSFDYTSIVIDPVKEGDILNRYGNSIIFTLHNRTKYEITYTARLIGFVDVQWNNKADLYGYISGVHGTDSAQSNGSGTYPTYSMNVKKYAEGDMNKGLAARFELFEARTMDSYGQKIQEPHWAKVGEFTTDAVTGIYEIKTIRHEGETMEQSVRRYSYHENGVEQFGNDGSETFGWRYRIKEIEVPEGYQRTDVEFYEFGISDIPSYSAPYNYLNDDTVTIVNKPIPAPVEFVISGRKTLVGKELADQEFTFLLFPEESVHAEWGEQYPGGFEGSLTAKNDADGKFGFSLTFTYDDYANAVDKGFVDANRRACFYYVVEEVLPEGAVDHFWNGVWYDQTRYLAVVRLFADGNQLRTQTEYYRYNGSVNLDDLQLRQSPRPPQNYLGRVR